MTVTHIEKDVDRLTMDITAEFQADAGRVWKLWSDPRQLEQWWGPPGYPATFTEHDLSPGGAAAYHMTGPDGTEYHGWWRVVSVDPPHRLQFSDGFADEEGNVRDDMPTTTTTVTITSAGDGATSMLIKTEFASRAAMDELLAMGAEEGMKAALGQIDDLLAASVPDPAGA